MVNDSNGIWWTNFITFAQRKASLNMSFRSSTVVFCPGVDTSPVKAVDVTKLAVDSRSNFSKAVAYDLSFDTFGSTAAYEITGGIVAIVETDGRLERRPAEESTTCFAATAATMNVALGELRSCQLNPSNETFKSPRSIRCAYIIYKENIHKCIQQEQKTEAWLPLERLRPVAHPANHSQAWSHNPSSTPKRPFHKNERSIVNRHYSDILPSNTQWWTEKRPVFVVKNSFQIQPATKHTRHTINGGWTRHFVMNVYLVQ